jgi:hypothetical protein
MISFSAITKSPVVGVSTTPGDDSAGAFQAPAHQDQQAAADSSNSCAICRNAEPAQRAAACRHCMHAV